MYGSLWKQGRRGFFSQQPLVSLPLPEYQATAYSIAAEANLATGRQSRLSQDAEPAVPSGDLLEGGFGVLPRCRSAGWVAEWQLGEGGVCTPRSDSSLSLHSSSSSGRDTPSTSPPLHLSISFLLTYPPLHLPTSLHRLSPWQRLPW